MTDALNEISDAARSVHVAMRRLRGRETRRHNGLSYAQYGLLFELERGHVLSARKLGEAAELSPASVTQMLEGLEANGLVVRKRSDDDKRIVLTELTDRGQSAVNEMRTRLDPLWRAALAEFSEEDLRNASTVLSRLADYYALLAETGALSPSDKPTASATADAPPRQAS